MASHVVVIASDFKRTTVKVTPGTYLTDVLEEACKKFNIPSDKYLLKHKQKQVDLSIPFRTSGLVQGAKLELVQRSKTPSAIQVALQVPPPEGREIPGGRLIQKFPSDLTLWKVLRQFESGKASNGRNVNITARGVAATTSGANTGSGQLYYEIPVLNIMGRELSSFADFQKTLSQLGYNSGSVLIRLSYRQTEQTLYDVMGEISRFFQDTDIGTDEKKEGEVSSTAGATSKQEQEPSQETPDTPMAEPEPERADVQQPEQQEELISINDQAPPAEGMDADKSEARNPLQPVNVYLAPSGPVPAAALAPPDDTDYTPTIAHAQLHQHRLQESSRNKRLLSDKELEEKAAAEEAKINAIKSVVIKVRFPDNTSSDWEVGPNETGQFLYQAVRHVMANESQPFHLVLPGGKTVIKDDASPRNSLIKAYKISGRILINLVWDDSVPAQIRQQPFLKSNVARQGQEVKAPKPIEVETENETRVIPQARPEKSEGSADKGAKKIPKWLKLGRK